MVRSGAAILAALLAGAVPACGERLPLRVLTTANGLLHDQVVVVRQDSRGLLWFGTAVGVSRFDGTTFRNYGTAEGLPEGLVADILETRSGDLLFATDSGGVCRLLPPRPRASTAAPAAQKLFSCARPGPAPEASSVRVLHQDRRGRLWVGTGDGLYRSETGSELRLLRRVPLGLRRFKNWTEGIRAIVEDPRGGLWLATAVGIAYRAADGKVTQYRVSSADIDDRVFALLLDRGGRLWIGHVDEGLFVWNPPAGFVPPSGWSLAAASQAHAGARGGTIRLPEAPGEAIRLSIRDGLDDERVRTGLLEDADGAIWIGTVRGLGRFHDGRLDRFTRRNGLPDDGVRPSLIDRTGNLWLGSASGGAMRLRRGGFTTYDETDGLRGFRIRGLFEGRDGALYVLSSAERDFIQRFADGRFEAVAPRLPAGTVYTGWWTHQVGLQDRQGEWWLPISNGLLRYPRVQRFVDLAGTGHRAWYTTDDGIGEIDVEILYEDRQGDIWIGTFNLGPYQLSVWRRRSGRFERFSTAGPVPRPVAPTIFREDAAGRLWIGFGDGTLARFQDGHLVPVALSPQASVILDLHFDGRGRLWVATTGAGLLRLDDPGAAPAAVRSYTTANGLAANDVTCLTEDLRGRIYTGTSRGVDRLDPATGTVRHFSTADGLANNLVRVAFRDRRGDLWFGTMQGLSRLHVATEPPPPSPRVLITSLEIAGVAQAVPETGVTRLGGPRRTASSNRVRIGFTAPSADQEVEPLYRYRLEGLDREWSVPARDRTVNYAGLAPGRFRFAVQAVHPDGGAGPPALVELSILPPLWRRWWALTAMAALLATAAYGFHRQRLARLLAIERVRTRIAADLHDDLGASLSRIAVLSEVASRKVADDGGAAPELLQIADTARGLVDETSDIVWSIDPHHDDLGSLLVRLRRLAADLLGERGIALELSGPPAAESIRLTPDQRRHLLLILKEAIHNAARHAGATRVEIRLEASDHRLAAEVRDDGRGFEVREPEPDLVDSGGRGLRNMRTRTRELGGDLKVRSAPGAGTTLHLSIPRR